MLVCSVSFSEFLTLVGNEKTQEPSTDYLILAFKMFDRSVVFRCIKFAPYLHQKGANWALNMVLSWLNYSLNSSQIALLKDAVPATYRDALLSVYMNISLAVIGWLAAKIRVKQLASTFCTDKYL